MTRAPAARGRGPATNLRSLTTGCLVLAVAVCLRTGWGDVPLLAAPLLTGLVAAAELAVLQLRVGHQRWPFSLSSGALAAALLLGPGAWCVPAMGVAVAVAQTVRRQPRRKRMVDVARCVLAAAVGQAVTGLAGGGPAGAAAGMAAFWALDWLLSAVAVSQTSRRPLGSLVMSGAAASASSTACSTAIGLLAAHLTLSAPFGLLGLLVPLGMLWSSYGSSSRRSADARLFAELARAQERETSRSQDVAARVVVTAVARLLGGVDVELVVLAAEGPVCFVGDEHGASERRPVPAEVFDEPWVLRALGQDGASCGRDDGRPWLTAAVGEPRRPQAVLRTRRCLDAPGFDREELRLVSVLTGQVEVWLAPAGTAAEPRDDGDAVVAPVAPALGVVRESAHRLARVAERSGSLDEVLDELALVERAVASLLGDAALPAVPEQPGGPDAAVPHGRPGAEWTTTGVLR